MTSHIKPGDFWFRVLRKISGRTSTIFNSAKFSGVIHAFGSDGRTVNTKIPELKKYDIIREYGETFQFTPLM